MDYVPTRETESHGYSPKQDQGTTYCSSKKVIKMSFNFVYCYISMANNINIATIRTLDPPLQLQNQLQITQEMTNFINITRNEITNILNKNDNRLLCIVGPCSIHNIDEALEYGKKLKKNCRKSKGQNAHCNARIFRKTPHNNRLERTHQ